MAKKSKKNVISQATETLAEVAQAGLEGIKSVAAAALGAGAETAASVAVKQTGDALVSGGTRLKEAAPRAAKAAGKTMAKPFAAEPPRFVTKSVAKKRSPTRSTPRTGRSTSRKRGD